jgi:glycolate oxidase iron-sulfur subunit
MASEGLAWPLPDDAPAKDDLSRCVHCGLCLNACPTYAVTGLETESPRGRIYLARAVDEGHIPLTVAVQGHWDLCLQCRACEAVCPSGVPYGRLMEHVRAQVAAKPAAGGRSRWLRRFVLRNVVARPRVLAVAALPARLWAGSRLRRLARITPVTRLLGPLRTAEGQLPARTGPPLRPGASMPPPEAPGAKRVVLFTGCIMGELFGDVHRATARVLARAGFAPEATVGQRCCGALSAHDGDLAFARTLARANIDALEATGDAPIVVNSAGCGAALKEYGDLLSGDAAYAERARRFGARVRDLSEVVVDALPAGRFPHRVAYQDACHLAHAQRIRTQPRQLLGALDGVEMVETAGSDLCCGAAGLYSLVQPAMSASLRARKAEQFAKRRPEVVVTANPGCHLQYIGAVREAGIPARVMHLAEVLDEATRP